MQDILTSATNLVDKGFYVLPLKPNGKVPITRNGVLDAQSSREFVDANWTATCDKNIGIACNNILVIDVDVKSGNGRAELAEMEKDFGKLSPRGKVITPTGGLHLYFRNPNSDISGQTHLEFRGNKTQIDLRVDKQFVVAPPSVIDGAYYQWEIEPSNVDSLSDLPDKWIDFLPKRRGTTIPQLPIEVEPTSYSIEEIQSRCRRYLSKDIMPAVQGQSGQKQLFRIANVIFNGFALSKEDGWPILLEYNQFCIPPFDLSKSEDYKFLHHAVDKAIATAQYRGHLLNAKREDRKIDLPKQKIYVDEFEEEHIVEEDDRPVDIWSPEYVPQTPPEQDETDYISDELLAVPGFINLCMGILERNATYFNRYACFAGVMALLSTLAGPRFKCHNIYSNMYLISLSGSGTGKDFVRQFNQSVFSLSNKPELFGRYFSSGEALEDSIIKTGTKLYQIDECDFLFKTLAQGKEAYQRSMQQNLLEFYSTVSSRWARRENAMGAKLNTIDKWVWNPFLTILGTAPPTHYYDALSRRITEGGLFARLIIIKSPNCTLDQDKDGNYEKDPEFDLVTDIAKFFLNFVADEKEDRNLAGKTGPIESVSIPLSKSAREKFKSYSERAFALSSEPNCDESQRAILNRAVEKAYKFALLYELSRKAELLLSCKDERGQVDIEMVRNLLEVDDKATNWAIRLSQQMVNLQLTDLQRYFFENEYERTSKLIYDIVYSASHSKKQVMERSLLYQKANTMSIQEVDSIIQDLRDRKKIEFCEIEDKSGTKKYGYRACRV